jgi:LacI family transcriptional regulator
LDEYLAGSITPPLLAGMYTAAQRVQHKLLLFTDWEEHAGPDRWVQFLDGHIDGLIWVDPAIDDPSLARIASAGLPVISVLSRHVPDGVGFVNADNIGGIVSVVRHLYELGHRRIAYASRIDRSNYIDRLEGYRTGLSSVGLPRDPKLESTGIEQFKRADIYYDSLDRWFALDDKPTAIILPDDRIANEMVAGLTRRGIRVPLDVSVIGFDDAPDPQSKITGGLSTVRQDFRRSGELAVEQLRRLVAGAPFDDCRTTVPTQLIVRNTTGARSF